ncbi:hypothetical protein [Clostridium sp.]|uniref:hypothetical protein n=1 Tax=Clostridium sp. TaxID=1506 RepID=UPI001A452811|nr:hypothetical protein [Clostridium sp.]MBK5237288.1 hypothetical protein [Clostridium sp.]
MNNNEEKLKSIISTCYRENGTILEGVQEYSIYDGFKEWFGDYVNHQLVELKLLKKRQYFFILSIFSEPGNVFSDYNLLFSIENLNNCIKISKHPTFEEIESMFMYALSEQMVADTSLGNAYLLNPLLQRYIRTHNPLRAWRNVNIRKYELEYKIDEFWEKLYDEVVLKDI